MKARPEDLARQLAKGPLAHRLVLLFGPDEAGCGATADLIVASLEPGIERVALSGAALKTDPSLLAVEAASRSLFGEARYIRVTTSGEEALAALEKLLAAETAANPVIVLASGITEKAHVAKLVAKSPHGLAVYCTFPAPAALAAAMVEQGQALGLVLDPGIALQLVEDVSLNRRLAAQELEKLALYLDAAPDNMQAVTADLMAGLRAPTDDEDMAPIVNSVLSGDTQLIDRELARLSELAISDVGLVLALQRRAVLLVELAVDKSSWVPASEKSAVSQQMSLWRGPLLERLTARLIDLQRRMMQSSQSSSILLKQELLAIAHAADRTAARGQS